MNNYLVTAIITTHNRAPDIVQRAIISVTKQTYKNIEIIVVDDSAPSYVQRDEVEQTVHNISDKIVYIKHETNQGACAARNTGLRYSHGYYIAFLDDDDEWYPTKIEMQILGFTDDTIALVYSGIIIVDEVKNSIYKNHCITNSDNAFRSLFKVNIIGTTSNPLIKKNCIEQVGGFDEYMQSSQDRDLFLRLTMNYSIQFLNIPLLKYHVHSEERISTDVDKKISGLEHIILKYANYINGDKESWYYCHISLLPYYLKKYGRKKAFATWIHCVQKQIMKPLMNLKYLFMIIVGTDIYSRIGEIYMYCVNRYKSRILV